ncbi:tRNA pseudouridine(38-40) synthase TruA [Aggregicoccus sp. 17bor-14]|nr:tRNA pseudouridine(38-40) synthase TruA [Simulacricoccus sp. 17bor-14]MRI89824.1 tRNA pseudouridine(38-40) synthase TruA [Aggregicoccus sp. 17bor-14]
MQEALEAALARAGVPSTVMPSGRTDRGVHARMQVVSVRLPPGDSAEALAARLAPELPQGLVGLCAARRPAPSFHAQWSASGKEYRYRVQLEGAASPAWAGACWSAREEPRLAGRELSAERLARRLAQAVGTRDFLAFHERSSPQKPRTLERAELVALGGGLYEARLRGDSFARYQVRYLVGSALLAAAGVLDEAAWEGALMRAEPVPGLKAPGHGLVLWEVRYPAELDPFSAAERACPPGLPEGPPFT